MPGVTCIVSEFRAPARPIFRPMRAAVSVPKPAPYAPATPGTVRGPYICGKGNDSTGGVQFLVRTRNGWVPFIEARGQEGKARQEAEAFAVNHVGT